MGQSIEITYLEPNSFLSTRNLPLAIPYMKNTTRPFNSISSQPATSSCVQLSEKILLVIVNRVDLLPYPSPVDGWGGTSLSTFKSAGCLAPEGVWNALDGFLLSSSMILSQRVAEVKLESLLLLLVRLLSSE